MRRLATVMCLFAAGPCLAETVVAARTIRPQEILTAQDLAVIPGDVPGAVLSPQDLIGQEARLALYAGRPIRPADVGPPAVIDRNQIVTLVFDRNGLMIITDGRSLQRAAPGERVRVMNISSRSTVTGRVLPDGRVLVSD